MKRTLDILISCALIVVTAPLIVLVISALKLEHPGPVIVRRVQFDKRSEIWTFRTGHGGQLTRIGSFLRHTRIEHLPQLFNVLHGDLTLVGHDEDRKGRPDSWLG